MHILLVCCHNISSTIYNCCFEHACFVHACLYVLLPYWQKGGSWLYLMSAKVINFGNVWKLTSWNFQTFFQTKKCLKNVLKNLRRAWDENIQIQTKQMSENRRLKILRHFLENSDKNTSENRRLKIFRLIFQCLNHYSHDVSFGVSLQKNLSFLGKWIFPLTFWIRFKIGI